MKSSLNPLSGMYRAHDLKGLYYGPDVVKNYIRSALPTKTSKAFIITGNSLATKTPLIGDLEALLGSDNLAGTFSDIKEHATIEKLDEVTARVEQNTTIDTIISVGGGSPIDSAKAIIFRIHETSQKWLTHITIPTTLSAAECTVIAGYTRSDGVKTSLSHPRLYPAYIFYDPKFGLYTPPQLFLSSGIRALDHAVEIQYHSYATWMPTRLLTLNSITELFRLLPLYKVDPKNMDVITGLFLAAYASLGFLGQNVAPTLMLSHSLGYALGSPYGIPHGITSCMTLGRVVKLMATLNKENAQNIAAIMPYVGEKRSGDDLRDCDAVGDRILELVGALELKTTLTEHKVGMDQLDIITARSLRLELGKEIDPPDKELFQTVKELVRSLW
jgi:alcohol dehydrogenase class IV